MSDEFVLLVHAPSEGWVIWAWSDKEDYLKEEGKKLACIGYEAMIYTKWREVK